MDTNPKIIVCDCDGVLTDGKFFLDGNGGVTKSFNTRDVRAIKELISFGFEFWIVTASSWSGIDHFAKKTGAVVFVMRDKGKLNMAENDYIAIGDDVWDVEILKNAWLKFCPSNADRSVLSMPGIYKLDNKGGDGCIAELANILRPIEVTK